VTHTPLRSALSASLFLLAAGCDALVPGGGRFDETRLYTFDFFESYEACEAAQPDPNFWINCSQMVTFCPGGQAEVMVTDIVHLGTYRLANRTLRITLPENPELNRVMRFRLSGDGEEITEEDSGVVFRRKYGEELTYAEQSCSWKS
jgi:hypothetical protein